jgi:hypothetical protein
MSGERYRLTWASSLNILIDMKCNVKGNKNYGHNFIMILLSISMQLDWEEVFTTY